jgi:hypothetical protein
MSSSQLSRLFFLVSFFSFQSFASDSPSCRDILRNSSRDSRLSAQKDEADERVVSFVIQEKRLPAGKEWDELLGHIQAKYFGTGAYRMGFSGSHARLHNSPSEAYESLLAKIQVSEVFKKKLSEDEKVEILENLKEKIAYNRLQYNPIYLDSDLEFLQNKAHDLVIRFIVLHKRLPRGPEWTDVLGNPSKYFGNGRYEKMGSSGDARLHDSPRHAYGRLLLRLLSFDRPDLLSFEDHIRVLTEIEEKIRRRL